ncbi:MAG: OmpA family protein [Acidobacteriota bacterium]
MSSVLWTPWSPIYFAPGDTSLSASARRQLTAITQIATSSRGIALTVNGHADSAGLAATNLQLSHARAAAVKAYLGTAGVSSEQMTVKALGETEPVCRDPLPRCRRESRRVEIGIWFSGTARFENVMFDEDFRPRLVVHLPDDHMPDALRIRVFKNDGHADVPLADVSLPADDPRVLTPPRMLDVADMKALLPAPYRGQVRIEVQLTPATAYWPVVGLMDARARVKARFLPR